ncbi:MAG: hypothetical protein IPG21_11105, partial [Saprospiraceae bacterium]|nr:hypothetical protein [Candidatus Vicinibacter affinis]
HPVMIITKNALIQRDLDLLGELNDLHLVQVAISVAAHDRTRRVMEPRASTIASRFRTIRLLAERGIPVHMVCWLLSSPVSMTWKFLTWSSR